MFGHGSIWKNLYKYFVQLFSGKVFVDEGLRNCIAHIYVYIYVVINHTIVKNCLVKGVFEGTIIISVVLWLKVMFGHGLIYITK
jgi:hypothetical protein